MKQIVQFKIDGEPVMVVISNILYVRPYRRSTLDNEYYVKGTEIHFSKKMVLHVDESYSEVRSVLGADRRM